MAGAVAQMADTADVLRHGVAQGSTQQMLARDRRAVAHRTQLFPDHFLGHRSESGGSLEAAIGSRDAPSRIADGSRYAHDALGDDLRMFNIVCSGVDDAGDQ